MAKAKQRQQVAIPANNISTPSCPEDLPGEDSWVMVKKQKVTILIPPMPFTKQSATPNSGESQPQAKPSKTINTHSPKPIRTNTLMHSVFAREKSTSLTPEKAIPTARKVASSQPISTFPNPPRIDHRKGSENPPVDNSRCRRPLGLCSASKVIKGSRRFLGGDVLPNQSIRALNLERKLQRAGGLSSWLASLGLDQFVKIFQGKSVDKFHLVNLTMKKLKDMGADAVGPRRKLMHAMDCLCQPYCFEAL